MEAKGSHTDTPDCIFENRLASMLEQGYREDEALLDEWFTHLVMLDGDAKGQRRAAAYMQQSTAICHNEIVASAFAPRIVSDTTWQALDLIARTMYTIIVKVMQHYKDDEGYRSLFAFDKRLEELIMLDRGYSSPLPFARIDLIPTSSQTFGFCEFNTDGSSGMNEDREVYASICTSESTLHFSKQHTTQSCELIDSWIDAFMRIYDDFPSAVKNPHVALCDYLDCATLSEFKVYQEAFIKRGIPCSIVDIRTVRFENGCLQDAEGKVIHAIWRRCVTNDVLKRWDESQTFLNAIRAGSVALIGSFAGHIAHDKRIFNVLHHPATHAFLTPDECRFVACHIPRTLYLKTSDLEAHGLSCEALDHNDWVIKPTDSYGADNVYVGADYTQEQWDEILQQFIDGKSGSLFLLQRRLPDRPLRTIPLGQSTIEPSLYGELCGLYIYDGVLQGIFTRLGPHHTICGTHDGLTAATMRVLDQTMG